MARPLRVRVTGPLAPFAAGFRQELANDGYTPNAASNQLQLMAHASRWLDGRGLGVDELTPAEVEEFLAHRRAEGYTLWLSSKAVVPMLDYLRGLGVVATPTPSARATEAEHLQENYRAYLVQDVASLRAPWLAICTWRGCSSRCAPLAVNCILIGSARRR